MRTLFSMLIGLLLSFSTSSWGQYSAKLIFFTADGKETGTALLPGFSLNSCWSGIGAASNGSIYLGVCNHINPGGNVAMFKYDPAQDKMSCLGDLKSISTAVSNWMPAESQMKVHSFIKENADGKMYFTTDDYDGPFERGAHLYYINLANDQVVDYSHTQPKVMKDNFSVINNAGTLADTSGIFIQRFGVKGICLNPQAPDYLYGITWPDGNVIKYRFTDGSMQKIAQAGAGVPYVMYVDNSGNLYFCSQNGSSLDLKKYTVGSGAITTVKSAFDAAAFSMAAPTAGGDTVYFCCYNKNIYRLICSQDRLDFLIKYSGTIWASPGLFNLTLTPDGKTLFVLAIDNNPYPWERLGKIDLTAQPVTCNDKFDTTILSVVGDRNLCFGGVNVWDKFGNFYAPCWGDAGVPIALLKVHTPYNTGIKEDFPQGLVANQPSFDVQFAPNPLMGKAQVELITLKSSRIHMALYDMSGKKVKTFYDGFIKEGRHCAFWDGTSDASTRLLPGIYLCYVNGALAQKVLVRR